MKKNILLIEDETKTTQNIAQMLSNDFTLRVAQNLEEATKIIQEKIPALVILDFDLKEKDGLTVFRALHPLIPQRKVIMISRVKDIPLAVMLSKIGVADFLSKPLSLENLQASIKKHLFRSEDIFITLKGREIPFLEGEGPKIKFLFSEIEKALQENQDIILWGKVGTEKVKVAELIHHLGFKKERKFVYLNLNSFRQESAEALFWATLQEVTAEASLSSLTSPQDLCGTLYLENLENLNEYFQKSILDFFQRKSGRFDREIKMILGISNRRLPEKMKSETARLIEIPPLAERKEDLPYLINFYLASFCRKFGKGVKYISAEVLELLLSYDFPGNYKELETMMALAVFFASEEKLEREDLPLDFEILTQEATAKVLRKRNPSLAEARLNFEKSLFRTALKESKDLSAAARFLDFPKSALEERLQSLGFLPS